MSLFKQHKNKQFSYTPRHLAEPEGQDKAHQGPKPSLKRARGQRGNASGRLLVLSVVLGMIIVIWYILDQYNH